MSLAFVMRDGERFWLATNSTIARDSINIPNEYSPSFPLFKVKDVLICYHGPHDADDDILMNLEFSKITVPLSEHSLFEQFFVPMNVLVQKDNLVAKEGDTSIKAYPSSFFFLTSKEGFAFDGAILRKINLFEMIGTAQQSGGGALDHFFPGLPPKKLVVEVIRSAIRFSTDTTYPIFLANTEDEEMQVIEEDGSEHKVKIPTWEKGRIR